MTGSQQYAISKYPDVEEIYRRLDALVRQPMRRVRDAACARAPPLAIRAADAAAVASNWRRLRWAEVMCCSLFKKVWASLAPGCCCSPLEAV